MLFRSEKYILFKKLQKLVDDTITEALTEYHRTRIQRTPANKLFNELKNLGLISRKTSQKINHSFDDINRAFADVSIDPHCRDVNELMQKLAQTPEPLTELFKFTKIECDDVRKAISSFTSNATGVDGLSPKLVRITLPAIIHFLTEFFNLSLTKSYYPLLWKKSLIIPFNKATNPKTTHDYRPISISCFLAKVLDKLVYYQIEKYVNYKNLHDPYQSAYRPFHSTQSTLLKFVSDAKKKWTIEKSRSLSCSTTRNASTRSPTPNSFYIFLNWDSRFNSANGSHRTCQTGNRP